MSLLSIRVYASGRTPASLLLEASIVLLGSAFLAAALFMNHAWVDRHFLPEFFRDHALNLRSVLILRIGLVALGVATITLLRRWAARATARLGALSILMAAAPSLLALVLAVAVSEIIVRTAAWRVAAEAPKTPEPQLQADPRLGWRFTPGRVGYWIKGGRRIAYAIDAGGRRAASPSSRPDMNCPTIVFAGESIIAGVGLQWPETIPAQVGQRLGVQSVSVAVNGFATDQAYMRLKDQLPRFHRPLAVVMLFSPALFWKNLQVDRPHFGPGLVWQPARPTLRLAEIAHRAVPYLSDAEIEAGVQMTRAVLRATLADARARGAEGVILTPVFTPEEPGAVALRRRILDQGGIPYLLVPLDQTWRIQGDGHPDPRGARVVGEAVAARLKPHIPPNSACRSGS